MISRITIVTGSHLNNNPRVLKEATALQEAGYDVEVFGGWFDPVLKAQDQELMGRLKFRFRPLHDLTQQPVLRFGLRIRGKMANLIHSKTGYESRWQLGYFVSALTRAARRSQADLLIAHSEQALWAVAQVQKSEVRRQKAEPTSDLRSPISVPRIGVDMEDWFSEDLPLETRRHRPIQLLKSLEQGILSRASHATCTSRAMSEALAKEYGCRPPVVIYNAFPWSDRATIDGQFKDRQNRALPSIHWFSQTLGTDRGLDDLFAALPFLKHEVEIHLRGKLVPGFEEWLNAHVTESWRKRIFVHGLVSNDELLSRIAEHDIGFAGEQKSVSHNRDLTVTNKILHYLLGGLAVVASDTVGQREIATQANGVVQLYCSGDPAGLAAQLNESLASLDKLQSAKAAALRVAEQIFCWEKVAPSLVRSVEALNA